MLAGDNWSELILFGEDLEPRIWFLVKDSGEATSGFFDTRGKCRASIGTSKNDTGLVLYDADSRERVVVGTMNKKGIKRNVSSLLLLDGDGKMRWSTPVIVQGE